jgi:AraC family transcriptional regulator
MNPQLAQGEFYGQTLKNHNAPGFSLSETRYAPGSRLAAHSHESPYFGFILRGTYTERYGRGTRTCHPSMLVFHPAGELHAQHFGSAVAQLFRVEVNHARLRDLEQSTVRLEHPADFQDSTTINLARRLYREFAAPDAVSQLAIEGLGLELIAAVARISWPRLRTSRQPPPWLEQAREIIKSRFLEQLKLGEIARAVGVHPVTLAREFRRFGGCTIGEMVRRERIQFACREILRPAVKLADVAMAAGFYDQSHFSRAFKLMTGLTPTQFRANPPAC